MCAECRKSWFFETNESEKTAIADFLDDALETE